MIPQRLLQRLLANPRCPTPHRTPLHLPRLPNLYSVSSTRCFSVHNTHCDKNKNVIHGVKPPAQTTQPKATLVPGHGQPDILRQASLSNKDQRGADWAIMKEMAKYLWPKVSFTGYYVLVVVLITGSKDNTGVKIRVALSLGLLIGAKVSVLYIMNCNMS